MIFLVFVCCIFSSFFTASEISHIREGEIAHTHTRMHPCKNPPNITRDNRRKSLSDSHLHNIHRGGGISPSRFSCTKAILLQEANIT